MSDSECKGGNDLFNGTLQWRKSRRVPIKVELGGRTVHLGDVLIEINPVDPDTPPDEPDPKPTPASRTESTILPHLKITNV